MSMELSPNRTSASGSPSEPPRAETTSPEPQPTTDEAERLDHVRRARLQKLSEIIALGVNPYPYKYERSHTVADLVRNFTILRATDSPLRTAGRIAALRVMGKAAFADLKDEGWTIQLYFKKDRLGEAGWKLFNLLDIGDLIGASGRLFLTRTGERTIDVADFQVLAKNIRPLPAAKETDQTVYNRWADFEERARHRPVDLLLNADSREVFLKRSRLVSRIRHFLDSRGFIEVETPTLQPIYGGAAAKPFVTYHHALDTQLFLRIADELYLKRLVAGGFGRVYEIAKDFRNEGIDRLHSPEFTMLEFYAAYEDYTFCVRTMEEMLPDLAQHVNGTLTLEWGGHQINLTPPYRKVTMADLLKDACGVDIVNPNRQDLAARARALGLEIEPGWSSGKIIDELFTHFVQPHLIDPTFVMDYPVELSPLAKRHRNTPGLVERFELFIAGLETANAFSELNDPADQRRRFEDQSRLRAQGDEEAPPIDEDYIEALELGMPPTAGLGMGIDRLTMLLTGRTAIRDVILFPIMRPRD